MRYSPTPNSDLLASFIYTNRNEKTEDINLFSTGLPPPFPPLISVPLKVDGKQETPQGELQHVYRHGMFNLTNGFMAYAADTRVDLHLPTRTRENLTIWQQTAYSYANITYPKNVTWTVGFAYDNYDEDTISSEKLSPKIGVRWNITDDLLFRAAAFQSVKPAIVASQTLQPTEVAGFNQLFDDVNGTVSKRLNVGLDARLTDDVAIGAEASWRDLDVPFRSAPPGRSARTLDNDEELYRAYLYWTPSSDWSLRTELIYDVFDGQKLAGSDNPTRVKTFYAPVSARYFHPSGFFAGAAATFVSQDVRRQKTSLLADGSDKFTIVDAAVGYRFPMRRGMLSFEVKNMFDKSFNYQDDNYREFGEGRPSVSPFLPERMIMGRLTLNF
jgi:hypothetical protein